MGIVNKALVKKRLESLVEFGVSTIGVRGCPDMESDAIWLRWANEKIYHRITHSLIQQVRTFYVNTYNAQCLPLREFSAICHEVALANKRQLKRSNFSREFTYRDECVVASTGQKVPIHTSAGISGLKPVKGFPNVKHFDHPTCGPFIWSKGIYNQSLMRTFGGFSTPEEALAHQRSFIREEVLRASRRHKAEIKGEEAPYFDKKKALKKAVEQQVFM